MKKIAIVGGGIIGSTLAQYLDPQHQIYLYDEGIGQATKASAGIISPWLSKRRNQKWYQLARDGAAFFPQLVQDLALTPDIYQKVGTLILRPEEKLTELLQLAEARRESAPEIGEIELVAAEKYCPLLKPQTALFISGGGRLNGQNYLQHLTAVGKAKGILFFKEKVDLKDANTLITQNGAEKFDQIILASGPHLKELLVPLGYQVDIRPQKGQLLAFQTHYKTNNWPVTMLDGEGDLIPFNDGKILLGATHENHEGWDLAATNQAFQQLTEGAAKFLQAPLELFENKFVTQVGTRAYTSDFAPFFEELTEGLIVASGLGSSGLTTGPLIGYLIAKYLNTGEKNWASYQKPLSNYIKKDDSLS